MVNAHRRRGEGNDAWWAGQIKLVANGRRQYVLQPRFVDLTTKTLTDQIESDAKLLRQSHAQPPLVERLLAQTVAFGEGRPRQSSHPPTHT